VRASSRARNCSGKAASEPFLNSVAARRRAGQPAIRSTPVPRPGGFSLACLKVPGARHRVRKDHRGNGHGSRRGGPSRPGRKIAVPARPNRGKNPARRRNPAARGDNAAQAHVETCPPDITDLPQRPVVTAEAGFMTRPVRATGRVRQGPRGRHAPRVSPIATCHHRGRRLA
jgi:hypothetical protein